MKNKIALIMGTLMKNKIALIMGTLLCFYAGSTPLKAQSSSGKTAQKLFDMVVGKWTLDKASESVPQKGQKAKTSTLPEGDMQTIEFTREAKYVIRNQSSQTYDSGFYRANEDHKLIYLQSSIHPEKQPAEWHASLQNSMLTLTQEQPADKKVETYVYRRHANSGETAHK